MGLYINGGDILEKKKQSTAGNKKTSITTKTQKSSAKRGSVKGETEADIKELARKNQVRAIILFAVGIFLTAVVFIEGENVWTFLHNLVVGFFGIWSIAWPVLLIYCAVIIALEKPQKRIGFRVYLSVAIIFMICITAYTFSDLSIYEGLGFFEFIGTLFTAGTTATGAGLIGGLIGSPMVLAFGVTGARIIMVILLVVSIMILTGSTLMSVYKTFSKPVKAVSGKVKESIENRNTERRTTANQRINYDIDADRLPSSPVTSEQRVESDNIKSDKLSNLHRAFGIEKEEPIKKQERKEEIKQEEPEFPPIRDFTQNVEFKETESVTEEFTKGRERINEMKSEPIKVTSSTVMPVEASEDVLENATKAAEEFIKKREQDEKNELATEAQMALYDDSKNAPNTYVFPPLTFLAQSERVNSGIEAEELQQNGQKLVETLKSFGVQTKIIDICRGPSVTRYELQPAAGVKVSKITNLAKDLELNLAALAVRIEAPIPGKAAVGIEIPNKNKSVVRMRDLIESNAFATAKSKLTVMLGRDIAGQVKVADLAKMPHMLIAGTTGSGKSVCINSLIVSLMYKSSPDDVRFLMIDPKVVELGIYNGIPHLLVPVVTDPRKAAGALAWAVTEMLNRYKMFAEFNVKDLAGYNNLAKLNNYEDENGQPMLKMPQIVIIIDELADLMMAAPNEVEDSICRLAQMARAAGMHLVVATQRPTVDVVTGLIKANIPSRIAFAVSSAIDSRTILDSTGAEGLLGQGDMLFSPVGTPKPTRIQGCFVHESEIENVVNFVKKSRTIEYDDKIMEDIERNAIEPPKNDKEDINQNDMDPMMNEAIKCVIEAGQASTSLLQRRLRLGYARAGRLVDEMERMGIVGPHEGSKPRQVLMSHQQWLERNMQKPDEEKTTETTEE